MTDYQTLRAALRQARKAGLMQEFRDGYRRYRTDMDSVWDACWYALYDWDMLDLVDGRLTFGEKG